MSANVNGKLPGEVAIVIEGQLKPVSHDTNKLDHLKRSQVLFPPQILLVLRSHGRQHVVEIHDDMDTGVEKSKEGSVAAGQETGAGPDREGHDAMMDDMQQRDLIELFACHKTELENEMSVSCNTILSHFQKNSLCQ